MPIASMTGFARAAGRHGARGWTWELRSVNSRGLDLRLRLPPGSEALEAPVRQAVPERIKRGSVAINLQVTEEADAQGYRINTPMIEQLLGLAEAFKGRVDAGAPRLDALLAVRGVVEPVQQEEDDEAREARHAAMLKSMGEALGHLVASRAAEGARVEQVLLARLAEIEALVARAGQTAAAQPEAIKARLKQQVADLLEAQPALGEDRLMQEAALLAAKADVREELDRLESHIAAARDLLKRGGAVGRQLDFLCQEFNREANTLCSKSADLDLTRIGLDLKTGIEQLREQAANVE